MDGGGKTITRQRRAPKRASPPATKRASPPATKRASPVVFRDVDGTLQRRLEEYGSSRGLTLSDSARELIGKGLQASAADRVQLHELIPNLHVLIEDLHKRTPASANYHRVMAITLLETVMLLRQLVAATQKPEVVQKAKKNAMEAFEQLIREGTV